MKSNYLLYLLFILLLNSCATFKNSKVKKFTTEVNSTNLENIEGIYECNPSEYYSYHYNKLSKSKSTSKQHLLDKLLMNEMIGYKPLNALDSLEIGRNIRVKIIIDKKSQTLTIIDSHNDNIRYSAVIPFRVKKGFLYLDNQTVNRKGIPFLYSSVSKVKTRITLGKNNNLIVQRFSESSGSVFIMAAGSTSDYAYEFKRISD